MTIAVQPAGIDVLDTGPGVAEDERELVFERFHRGRAGRAGPPGTGLGLAIVRHLVEAHGGHVRADSQVGRGTTVAAYFPDTPVTRA